MRTLTTCAFGLSALLVAAPAALAEDAPPTLVFGTYYRCTQGTEDRADAIFGDHMLPALKAEVTAGRLTGWGWGRHWLGGAWRRLFYVSGTDLDKIIDARDAMVAKLMGDEARRKAMAEFDTVCASHDDYLWEVGAAAPNANDPARGRGAVAVSTYFVCDQNEDEADAILKNNLAPALNGLVKDGKMASWSWLVHRMGGKYRRALVLDGSDHKSAMKLWPLVVGTLEKEQSKLFARFGEICDSHSDYVWDLGLPAGK